MTLHEQVAADVRQFVDAFWSPRPSDRAWLDSPPGMACTARIDAFLREAAGSDLWPPRRPSDRVFAIGHDAHGQSVCRMPE